MAEGEGGGGGCTMLYFRGHSARPRKNHVSRGLGIKCLGSSYSFTTSSLLSATISWSSWHVLIDVAGLSWGRRLGGRCRQGSRVEELTSITRLQYI